MNSSSLKPLELWKSLLLVLIPAVTAYAALHFVVPLWLEGSGQPFFTGYMVWWMTWMGLVFIVSLVAYKLEGNPLTWQAFASRYRLRKLTRLDWLWVIGLLVVHGLAILALGLAGKWLASIPILAMPDSFPPELRPGGTAELVPGEFMGMALQGKWWIVALYFLGWVFNIFGEEFWWRGYLLPRQELTHGKWTWIVHGILWGANHLFQKWTLVLLVPTAFLFAYGAQQVKNTWVPIIVHGLMNLTPLIVIILGVIR
jgi:membrane protease YdiL (CAAX protease family)